MDSSRPQSIILSVLGIDAIPVGTKVNTMAGSITKQIIYHSCAPNYAHKPPAGQPFQIENTEPLRNRIMSYDRIVKLFLISIIGPFI